MKLILTAIAVIIIAIVILAFSIYAIEKHERMECEKWEREAELHENYFLTSWQKSQCDK